MNTAAEFLERERQLHQEAEAASIASERLFIWEPSDLAVVLGRGGDSSRQVHVEVCMRDNIPVLRRESGGGAVLLGPGCLNYSLILDLDRRPHLRDIAASYPVILDTVAEATGVPGVQRIADDLTVGRRKFAGSAQRRLRRTLLHHGTILYGFPIHKIERYLQQPERQPPYRNNRSHAGFLINASVDPAAFAARLQALYPEAGLVSV
ncbi:MAG TPA: hypothetical protein VFQ91_11350 [Bryobacteraceae bacterium]|nr:hypothetical protein [Bryobacteraceae bacterium]